VDHSGACDRVMKAQEGRRGEGRAVPARGKTLEGRSPGELRAPGGLNSRLTVADSRVEQDPVGEEARPGVSDLGSDFLGYWSRCEGMPNGVSSNDKRVQASETAYGCTRGAML
jgi:hypothetical protein